MSKVGFFFYTADWLKDTRVLSLAFRGMWIDLLCELYEKNGELTWTLEDCAQFVSAPLELCDEFVRTLSRLKIADVRYVSRDEITIVSRRIKRDASKREQSTLRKQKQRDRMKIYRESRGCPTSVTAPLLNPSLNPSPSPSLLREEFKNKNNAPHDKREWPEEDRWLLEKLRQQRWLNGAMQYLDDYDWWELVAKAINGIDREFIEPELAKMGAWFIENPAKTKRSQRGMRKFVRGWLERAKDNRRYVSK